MLIGNLHFIVWDPRSVCNSLCNQKQEATTGAHKLQRKTVSRRMNFYLIKYWLVEIFIYVNKVLACRYF